MALNPSYKGSRKYSIFYPSIPTNEVVNTEDLQNQLGTFIGGNTKPYYIDIDSLPKVHNIIRYYCIHVICPVISNYRTQVDIISLDINKIMEASQRLEEFMQPIGRIFAGEQNFRLEIYPLVNKKK